MTRTAPFTLWVDSLRMGMEISRMAFRTIGKLACLLEKSFTAKYSVSPHGQMSLTIEGQELARFQLTSSGEGPSLQFASSTTGSGQFYKQDTTTFSNASVNGTYVFQFLSPRQPGTNAGVGIMSYDGEGNISGFVDLNSDGKLLTQVPIAGTYSVDANGRMVVTQTATVGTASQTSQVATYLISSDRAVWTGIGSTGGGGLGMAEKQQITSFSEASLSGDFAFLSTSDPAVEPNFLAARLTADGAGTLSAGVADIFADFRNGGIWSKNVAFTGSYSIPATNKGRGTMSFVTPNGTEGAIFYLVSEKKAFLLGTSTDSPVAGQMLAQEGVPFSTSSLQGTYVFSMRGFDATGGEIGVLGSASVDGSGNYTGSEAVNHAGTLTPNETSSGTYSVGENGRGQLTMTVGGMVFTYPIYVVDSSLAFVVETDSSGAVLFGSLVRQF